MSSEYLPSTASSSDVQPEAFGIGTAKPIIVYQTTNNGTQKKTGSDVLKEHRLLQAIYRSSRDGRCKEGTFEAELDYITNWLDHPESHKDKHILWVNAGVGVGKSTVCRTISKSCSDKGNLAANFFFSKPKQCTDPKHLIPTLAFQIIKSIPETKELFDQEFSDPKEFTDMEVEDLMRVRLAPCVNESLDGKSGRKVIVIDGIDDCSDPEIVIKAVRAAIDDHAPFLWVISSRPDEKIWRLFHKEGDTEDFAIHASTADIELYLMDEFKKNVYDEYMQNLVNKDEADPNWPGEKVIKQLAKRSSGMFIYASCIIDFLMKGNDLVEHRLKKILNFSPSSATDSPFQKLDALYIQILDSHPPEDFNFCDVLRILGAVHIMKHSRKPNVIDSLLRLNGNIMTRLQYLQNVILAIPGRKQDPPIVEISFKHSSFPEFLFSERAPDRHAITMESAHAELAIGCLKIIKAMEPDVLPIKDEQRYALIHWQYHIKLSNLAEQSNLAEKLNLSEKSKLLRKELLHTLDLWDCTRWVSTLIRIDRTADYNLEDTLYTLEAFKDIIKQLKENKINGHYIYELEHRYRDGLREAFRLYLEGFPYITSSIIGMFSWDNRYIRYTMLPYACEEIFGKIPSGKGKFDSLFTLGALLYLDCFREFLAYEGQSGVYFINGSTHADIVQISLDYLYRSVDMDANRSTSIPAIPEFVYKYWRIHLENASYSVSFVDYLKKFLEDFPKEYKPKYKVIEHRDVVQYNINEWLKKHGSLDPKPREYPPGFDPATSQPLKFVQLMENLKLERT